MLIVDVQRGLINAQTSHIPLMVQKRQFAYNHIIATRFFNPDGSPFRQFLNWQRFAQGSVETLLAFSPRRDAVIVDKSRYSCVDDGLVDWLLARRIKVVHVCGIDSDQCVLKCAVDLFERRLEPVVLASLCASTAGMVAHANAMLTLERFIGRDRVVR